MTLFHTLTAFQIVSLGLLGGLLLQRQVTELARHLAIREAEHGGQQQRG